MGKPTKMFKITEKAAQEVKEFIKASDIDENDAVLRIACVGGGCSGWQYNLKIDESFDPVQDTQIIQKGIKVIVDKKSLLYLEGTTLDYQDELDGRGFIFNNPNATRTCGCGKSFGA